MVSQYLDPYENVLYRFYYITDYQPGTSMIIFNAFHALFDGTTYFPNKIAWTDDKNFKALGLNKPPSLSTQLKSLAVLPATILAYLKGHLSDPVENNSIHKPELLKGAKRSVRISEVQDYEKVKRAFARKNCSVN